MSDNVEPDDIVQQAKGRARFCRDRGEVKTPMLLDELVARIEELERERDGEATAKGAAVFLFEQCAAARARIAALEAEVARLREALAEERLENLWNAYNTGHERDGKWSHSFMSDGEWLIGEIGLDPSKGWYDAAEVKRLIPDAARAILAPPPEGETP